MKFSTQCSECGGRTIYAAMSRVETVNGVLPHIGGAFSMAQIEIYICGQCGHHQMFVPENELDRIRERYSLYSQDANITDNDNGGYPEL